MKTQTEILNEAGAEFVRRIREEFDRKKLNDTNRAKDSISYRVESNKIVVEGLARVIFLEFGRRSGKPPPFEVIRDWVERKLNVESDEIDGVAWAIVKKIAKEGTDILTDRAKGLQIELILRDIIDEFSGVYINFIAEAVFKDVLDAYAN